VSNTPPLWKTFLVFLAPMMLSNILQSLFGTINNIYLGQMIGFDALAADLIIAGRRILWSS
jgi:Na+-driven multidrug efflux pump